MWGRPQTEEASFRLVLSLQRCRMRSALGLGGTAGCGLGRSVLGGSSSSAGGQIQLRPAPPARPHLSSLFRPHPSRPRLHHLAPPQAPPLITLDAGHIPPHLRPAPRLRPCPQAPVLTHSAGSLGSGAPAAPGGGPAAKNGHCCADRCPG